MAGLCPGRTGARQIMLITSGTQGLQFAALGSKAYELAKSRGLGYNLPTEWFLQNIRTDSDRSSSAQHRTGVLWLTIAICMNGWTFSIPRVISIASAGS